MPNQNETNPPAAPHLGPQNPEIEIPDFQLSASEVPVNNIPPERVVRISDRPGFFQLGAAAGGGGVDAVGAGVAAGAEGAAAVGGGARLAPQNN